ncbi:MAG: IPT/TIG domain-containing protein [Terriglobales bacterium]
MPRIAIAMSACRALLLFASLSAAAQAGPPEVLGFSPASGPEGTRVEVTGRNLVKISAVSFGGTETVFEPISPEKVVVIVPHRVPSSNIVVITPQGRGTSPSVFVIANDPRIPDEVSYKAGYVNPVPAPADFDSARLWGIVIADTRVPGHESAQVEVAWTRLTCQIDGREVVLNDDRGQVRGGLYQRHPWFASDAHEPIPLAYDLQNHSVILAVGRRGDRVWHFWSPSARAALPVGKRAGCTVRARVLISPGTLLQMGMDYWRSPTIPYGSGGNNHEAGASHWYFPSPQWQEATFTDIGGPQF